MRCRANNPRSSRKPSSAGSPRSARAGTFRKRTVEGTRPPRSRKQRMPSCPINLRVARCPKSRGNRSRRNERRRRPSQPRPNPVSKPWRTGARSANRHTPLRRRSSALPARLRRGKIDVVPGRRTNPSRGRHGPDQAHGYAPATMEEAAVPGGVVHSPRRRGRPSEKSWRRNRLDCRSGQCFDLGRVDANCSHGFGQRSCADCRVVCAARRHRSRKLRLHGSGTQLRCAGVRLRRFRR